MKFYSPLGMLALLACAYVLDHVLGLNGHGCQLAALASFAGLATYDMSPATLGHIDLSDELSAVLLADTQLLGRIAMRGQATQVDHYWLEESLNATYVTVITTAVAAGDATLTVSSGDGGKLQIGALLVDQTLGKQEVLQVTAISGGTITVNRGVGDSGPSAEAHAIGALLRVIGRPKPEGDENVTDETVVRTRKHNNCQIFKKEVFISGTQQAVALAGVPNEQAHQTAMRLLELKREFGMTLYAGVKITAGGANGSDTVYRSMDGLRNFVRNNSSQLITDSVALSENFMNRMYHLIYDQGGSANVAVGTRAQMVAFSEMYKDQIRLAANDKVRGTYVTKFLTDLGDEIDLVTDRWALDGDLLMLDTAKCSWMPLKGRALAASALDKRGDALRSMMVGEYTLEFRNAGQCGALATGLTSRS